MLTELFKTKERLRILSYIMLQKNATVTQVSNATSVTKGLVSRYLNYLYSVGLITKMEKSYTPLDCAKTRAIKLLLNLDKIKITALELDFITGIGIFGSWAQGTNTHESDLDIWLKVEGFPPEYQLARLQKDIRAMAGVEVNMIILTPDKIESIKKSDPPFYNSLQRTSVVLMGDPIE
ncbi:MAG: ArsR family transcriptional regulator [Methanosarcinales archaeon]|nr:ArsR family transcriptional regulator [Methanosarcinales archaeon]